MYIYIHYLKNMAKSPMFSTRHSGMLCNFRGTFIGEKKSNFVKINKTGQTCSGKGKRSGLSSLTSSTNHVAVAV